ncbi:S-layer homology domain-containing protein [Paenibacillus ferrarius]|uniref:S-layer homology domain-containing protein n=1 Tax=Paenibacillus ferrarius TaxID=1469647 RepID=UPI003D282BCA
MKTLKLPFTHTATALSLLASLMLVQPAAAATAKTSADFTDLGNVSADLKAKLDAMIGEGIFDGVASDTFGIQQKMTRAQFAKVATKVFEIPVDLTVTASSFTDVRADDSANGWAIPYIEAAKKAGLIDGMTDTTFAPGDAVTTAQLDTILLKGLGKKVVTTGSPWYADAVSQATTLGIHPTGKGGDAQATREDLVVSAYGAQQAYQEATPPGAGNGNGTGTNPGTGSSNGSNPGTGNGTGTNPGTGSSTSGNVSIVGSYTLASVIDSGLTDNASGAISKADAENPVISKFAKEIEIKVTTNGGDTVAIPGVVQSVFSSDPNVAKVGLSADHHAYVLGNKPGTADVSVMVQIGSGDAKQLHVTVTVTSDPVKAAALKAGETSITKAMTPAQGDYTASFDAYSAMDLTITDNYGIKYEKTDAANYNFALGTLFIVNDIQGDAALGAVGTVTADEHGTVNVSGNVKYFELTAVSASGQKVTSYVTMTR